ncbi:MAG: hypothetical protein ACK2UP_08740 [Candidatus Promineifilaceae bacterium]|jgi:hypothetical protein
MGTAIKDKPLAEQIPFITTIFSAIVIQLLFWAFVDHSPIYVIAGSIAVIAALLFRVETVVTVSAGLLITYAFYYYQPGVDKQSREFWIVVGLAVLGAILQLFVFGINKIVGGRNVQARFAIAFNMSFAFIGLLSSYIYNFNQCSMFLSNSFDPGNVVLVFFELTFCGIFDYTQWVISWMNNLPNSAAMSQWDLYMETAKMGGRAFVMMPAMWAAFFATLASVGFNIFRPFRLIGRFFAIIGWFNILIFVSLILVMGSTWMMGQPDLPVPRSAMELIVVICITLYLSSLVYTYGVRAYQKSDVWK